MWLLKTQTADLTMSFEGFVLQAVFVVFANLVLLVVFDCWIAAQIFVAAAEVPSPMNH